MSQVIRCSCKHAFQDGLYGVGNRMGNEMKSGQVRCTVCGNVGGAKSTYKPSEITVAAAPAAKVVSMAKEKDKGKDKGKGPASKGKVAKPKIDRSKKMNKK